MSSTFVSCSFIQSIEINESFNIQTKKVFDKTGNFILYFHSFSQSKIIMQRDILWDDYMNSRKRLSRTARDHIRMARENKPRSKVQRYIMKEDEKLVTNFVSKLSYVKNSNDLDVSSDTSSNASPDKTFTPKMGWMIQCIIFFFCRWNFNKYLSTTEMICLFCFICL